MSLLNQRIDFTKNRYTLDELPFIEYPYRSTYILTGDIQGQSIHNLLLGLQGGQSGQYYHLNQSDYQKVQDLDNLFYPLNENPAGYLTEDNIVLPDGVVNRGTIVQDSNDLTLNTNWSWRMSDVVYDLLVESTLTFPPSNEGFHRIDIIVGNQSGGIQRIAGTETLVENPLIAPNIPVNTIPLVEVLVLETGIQSFIEFALASFVRYDINNQGLSPVQRLNARTNIQAVSKDTNDTRTGSLTQNGSYIQNAWGWTMNGRNWLLQFPNDTHSSTSFRIQNTQSVNPGGMFMTERGSTILRARGDSVTDYYILRLQGSSNSQATVVEFGQNGLTLIGLAANLPSSGLLRVGGRVGHLDAIELHESATLGQVNSALSKFSESQLVDILDPLKFDLDYQIGSPDNPVSGNITFNITTPAPSIGSAVSVFHQNSSAPTLGNNIQLALMGFEMTDYEPNELNEFVFIYMEDPQNSNTPYLKVYHKKNITIINI